MGKKSKRRSNNDNDRKSEVAAPAKAQKAISAADAPARSGPSDKAALAAGEKESIENLMFQDPFEDEYENEEMMPGDDEDDAGEEELVQEEDGSTTRKQAWTPSQGLEEGQTLEMDPMAYTMHHGLTPEWPALSFDFIHDLYGDARTRFPHRLLAVVGTQASQREFNKLQILKPTDLGRTSRARRKGDESDDDDDEEEDDEMEESSDEDEDDRDAAMSHDPVLEHLTLNHNGGVNRVRVMPSVTDPASFLKPKTVVATWSDVGRVHLYDVAPCLEHLERSSGQALGTAGAGTSSASFSKKPFFYLPGSLHGRVCHGLVQEGAGPPRHWGLRRSDSPVVAAGGLVQDFVRLRQCQVLHSAIGGGHSVESHRAHRSGIGRVWRHHAHLRYPPHGQAHDIGAVGPQEQH